MRIRLVHMRPDAWPRSVRFLSRGYPTWACRAAGALWLAVIAAGCGGDPARVGERLDPVSGVGALLKSVRSRRGRVKTVYGPGAGMRYTGPIKGRHRSVPVRADVIIGKEGQLRLVIKHPIGGAELYAIVSSEGEFLLEDYKGKKGKEGVLTEVVAAWLPGLELREEDLQAWVLFLPGLAPMSEENVALAEVKGQYVLEFWTRDHLPSRQAWVSAWSHAPLRSTYYAKDGKVAAELVWSRFAWLEKQKVVFPRTVTVRLPAVGRTIRLSLSDPQFDKRISDEAFEPVPSPGIEVEEFKPKPRGGKAGEGKATTDEHR